jgi:glycerate 2-kinase
VEVVVAPDSFKGGPPATEVAASIARGWRRVRPDDVVVELPLADGGEGTLEAMDAAVAAAERIGVPGVTGPDGRRVQAEWLLLPDRTGVIELASSSGLPLMAHPDPLGATTRGMGEVIADALDRGVTRLLIGLGGSASTDGGTGALRALGLELLDGAGDPLRDGGGGLHALATVVTDRLRPPPAGGVVVLTDVDNPLLGPRGAAATYAPQKGAGPEQVERLEAALSRLASLVGGPVDLPGAGAAGGTAYGLAALWGGELRLGSVAIADAAGLDGALDRADLVITGEGAFDATSLGGKVPSVVLRRAEERGLPVAIVAGRADRADPDLTVVELVTLAGSTRRSLAQPVRWLEAAGGQLARTSRTTD